MESDKEAVGLIRNRAGNNGRQSKLKKQRKTNVPEIQNLSSSQYNEPDDSSSTSRLCNNDDYPPPFKPFPELSGFDHVALMNPVVVDIKLMRSVIGWEKEDILERNHDFEQKFITGMEDMKLTEKRSLNILGDTTLTVSKHRLFDLSLSKMKHLLKGHGLRISFSSISYKLKPNGSTELLQDADSLKYEGYLRIINACGASVRDNFRIDGSNKISHLMKDAVRKYTLRQWLAPDENDDECVGVYRYKIFLEDEDNKHDLKSGKGYGWISDRSRLKDDPYKILDLI